MPPRAADRLRMEAGRLQIQLVREPQTREVLLWDVAVRSAVTERDAEKYCTALGFISAELQKQANVRSHTTINDREAQAVALLALVHVDQEPTTSSPESPEQDQ